MYLNTLLKNNLYTTRFCYEHMQNIRGGFDTTMKSVFDSSRFLIGSKEMKIKIYALIEPIDIGP